MKKSYTVQKIATRWANIISINELIFIEGKIMEEYFFIYYVSQASIKEQFSSIKNMLKMWLFNHLALIFKTYFTFIIPSIQNDIMLDEIEILFKVIEEKKTLIKVKYKAFANIAIIKLNTQSKQILTKEQKNFVELPKCKKWCY